MSEVQVPLSAELTIRMDSSLSFRHEWRGSEKLLIAMLGALEYTQGWMQEQITRTHGVANDPIPLRAPEGVNSLETEVPRDVALALYWKALEKLKSRIIAVGNSEPEAIFQLPTDLLQKL